jgi:hypothetical protein
MAAGIVLVVGTGPAANALAARSTAPGQRVLSAPSPNALSDDSPDDLGEIPVELIHAAQSGGYLPAVEVSINGSQPMKMMIDTGTNILVTFPGAIVGANPPIDSTGIPQGIDYNGTATAGTIALGTVSVGTVTTPQPIAFIDGSACTPVGQCLGYKDGIQGVIGIGQRLSDKNNQGDPANDLYSALAQLGPDLSAGYTVDFTKGDAVIRLGAPAAKSDNSVTLARAVDGSTQYPTGQSVFLNPVLCWTISVDQAVASSCNQTVLDTGQSGGIVRGDEFDPVITPDKGPPLPGSGIYRVGTVKSGAVVSFATSAMSEPFSSVVDHGKEPFSYGLFAGGAVETGIYNSANGIYLKHSIGFDNDSGAVIIGDAQGTPSAPLSVTATAGDSSVNVSWDAPEFVGDSALTGFVITVALPDGTVVSTMTTVSADQTSGIVGGLANGTAYSVKVAAVNDFGVGAAAADPELVTPEAPATPTATPTAPGAASGGSAAGGAGSLAATGAAPLVPAMAGAGLAAFGLGLLVMIRARVRGRAGRTGSEK